MCTDEWNPRLNAYDTEMLYSTTRCRSWCEYFRPSRLWVFFSALLFKEHGLNTLVEVFTAFVYSKS